MALWTPEAAEIGKRYIDRIVLLSQPYGFDPDEVAVGVRRYLEKQIERQDVERVTPGVLVPILAALGTPEAVVQRFRQSQPEDHQETPFEEPAPPPIEAPIHPEEEPLPDAVETRPLRPMPGVRIGAPFWRLRLLLGMLLPLAAIGFEWWTQFMAHLYRNPMPTPFHLAALLIIPITIFAVEWWLSHHYLRHQPLATPRSIWMANGYAFFLTFLVAFLSLSMLPGTLRACAWGVGILGLAPWTAALTALWQFLLLWYSHLRTERTLGPVFRAWLVGILIVVGLLAAHLSWDIRQQQVIQQALSGDPGRQMEALLQLRGQPDDTRLVESWNEARYLYRNQPDKREAATAPYRNLYYRLTGNTYLDTLPTPPEWAHWIAFHPLAADNLLCVAGKANVARPVRVAASQLHCQMLAAQKQSENPAVASLTWTLEMENRDSVPRVACAQMALPPDTAVQGFQVRGAASVFVPHPAPGENQTASTPPTVPTLVSEGEDRVFWACPMPAGGKQTLTITMSVALYVRDNQAHLRLPYLSEYNIELPAALRHQVTLDSPTPPDMFSTAFEEKKSAEGTQWQAQLSDEALRDPMQATLALGAPGPQAVFSGGNGVLEAVMRFQAQETTPCGGVALVIDNSADMRPALAKMDWERFRQALPEKAPVYTITVGDTLREHTPDFAPSTPEWSAWMAQQVCRGGCDAVPALAQAWRKAAEKNGGLVLWLHGALPVQLTSPAELRDTLTHQTDDPLGKPVRLLSVPLAPGPNRVDEALCETPGYSSIPVLFSAQDTLLRTAALLRGENPPRVFALDQRDATQVSPQTGALDQALIALALRRRIHETLGAQPVDQAEETAWRAWSIWAGVATPLSSVVAGADTSVSPPRPASCD